MPTTPITADRVKLYFNGTAIGCIQNAQFSGTTETKDIACAAASGYKDFAAGLIGFSYSGQLVLTEEGTEASAILALWKARTIITGKFEITGTGGLSVTSDGIITSLSISGNKAQADPVTFDITITGKGEPTIA